MNRRDMFLKNSLSRELIIINSYLHNCDPPFINLFIQIIDEPQVRNAVSWFRLFFAKTKQH